MYILNQHPSGSRFGEVTQSYRLGQIPDPLRSDPGIVIPPPDTKDPGIVIPLPGPTPLDVIKFNFLEAAIRMQLQRNVRADDLATIIDRRQRLRNAFDAVPKSFAPNLAARLLDKNDPLGRLFHYRLATATRNELLSKLLSKASEPI